MKTHVKTHVKDAFLTELSALAGNFTRKKTPGAFAPPGYYFYLIRRN